MGRRGVGGAVFVRGTGRVWRMILTIVGAVLLLALVLVTLGLWGSRGWLPAFLAGQRTPQTEVPADAMMRQPVDSPIEVTVRTEAQTVIHSVDERFISFAVDLSQVTGGRWWNPDADATESGTGTVEAPLFDFNRPRLDTMVRALAPAYLRVGGSESDKIFYDLNERAPESDRVPDGYESVLTAGQWDALNAFATRNGLDVVFTLNAGPSARDEAGVWQQENAEALIAYSAERSFPVTHWELGNEVNNFWYVFGVGSAVSARRYHQESTELSAIIDRVHPQAEFAGQGAMVWPVLGEPLGLFFGMSLPAIRRNGTMQGVVSWHYYPQQSRRGPIASRRAHPARLLEPRNLDEAAHWARKFRDSRDRFTPEAELWVGETGNAQFGGEPGLSDVYLGSLWWLDQLGLLAVEKHDVVIRQSLTGMNYGLIDETTLAPRPDYFNSLLWQRVMGRDVLTTEVVADAGTSESDAARVRAYSHRHPNEPAVTTLLINLHPDRQATIALEPAPARTPLELYRLSAANVFGEELLLNGVPLRLDAAGRVQEWVIAPVLTEGNELTLPPLGYAFVVSR